MIRLDEAALICDFAETYHVFDYRALPARYAATLAAGLRPNARIMQKISGATVAPEILLLSAIADACRVLVWQNTKDGQKGRNAPESLLAELTGNGKENKYATGEGFSTVEDFRAWREKMIGGGDNAR